MSKSADGEIPLVAHRRDRLSIEEVNRLTQEAWEEAMNTLEGRQEIAECLGVPAEALKNGQSPIEIESDAGLGETMLVAIANWALVTIVVPALIGLVQDQAKERLKQLWTDVLLPAIRKKNPHALRD